MKLQNHLITTIPEFVKYFNYSEFWLNRTQFVRDMSPSKVYYWEDGLKESYDNIKKWIETEAPVPAEVQKKGIESLEYILGTKIEMSDTQLSSSCVDFSKSIIRVEAGQIISLPNYKGGTVSPFTINIHKVEFSGHPNRKSQLFLGDNKVGEFFGGDFIYVTEVAGACIEILPTFRKYQDKEYQLISREGEFYSTLEVRDCQENSFYKYDNVISFAEIYGRLIYIDSAGIPFFLAELPAFIKDYLCEGDNEAVYVKTHNKSLLFLYRNGEVRSTNESFPRKDVISATFNNHESIIYKTI